MNVVIYFPPSPGCENSAQIISDAIGEFSGKIKGHKVLMRAPHLMPRDELEKNFTLNFAVDIAIFCERMIDHPALLKARYRILIPNPEWLDPDSYLLAQACTHVWHKSRFSLERLTPLFPHAKNDYLGFTSRDPGRQVTEYQSFLHMRGKVFTKRNTASILAYWKSRPLLPDLYLHFYLNKTEDLDYPGWLKDNNVHVRMGWLEREEYLDIASQHGIHLCTSEVEGFGHYINEARAMSSLVITTDAAPMNELVDSSSGILVKPGSTVPMHYGIRYIVNTEDLASAIDTVMTLNRNARSALGAAARQRFLDEGRKFRARARELFAELV